MALSGQPPDVLTDLSTSAINDAVAAKYKSTLFAALAVVVLDRNIGFKRRTPGTRWARLVLTEQNFLKVFDVLRRLDTSPNNIFEPSDRNSISEYLECTSRDPACHTYMGLATLTMQEATEIYKDHLQALVYTPDGRTYRDELWEQLTLCPVREGVDVWSSS